jgi:hypothetical protein
MYAGGLQLTARFMGIGAKKILDNRQVVMTLDHDVQNKSEKVSSMVNEVECRISKNMPISNVSQRNKGLIFTPPAEE